MRVYPILTLVLLSANCIAQISARTEITNGSEIDIVSRPFQVSIRFNNNHVCGGTIYNDEWIVTAAHCLNGNLTTGFKVAVGITEQTEVPAQLINVITAVQHPNYNGSTKDNDIGMFKLANKINFSEKAQPLRIIDQQNQDLNDPGESGFVSGWGRTESSASSNHLRGIAVPIITNSQANINFQFSYPNHPTITSNMIATDSQGPNGIRLGPCSGDSGGPFSVTQSTSGIEYLTGVVSWGEPTCGWSGPNSPTIYSNVLNFYDWIHGTGCQQNMVIDDPLFIDASLEASNTIQASNSVLGNRKVEFRAASSVRLLPGFVFTAGASGSFRASAGPTCTLISPSGRIADNSSISRSLGFFSQDSDKLAPYPNPALTEIIIPIPIDEGRIIVKVCDIHGRLISESVQEKNEENSIEIDVKELDRGIYILQVESLKTHYQGKFIKE